jgi:N-acetylglucosamine malate deacetylase 1
MINSMYQQFGTVGIVVAHPDDETLGMGGTIHNLTSLGIDVSILFLSSGVGARSQPLENSDSRKNSATTAMGILGVKSITFLDFPDNQFDSIPLLRLAKSIEDFIVEHGIKTLFTNSRKDLNVDHQRTAEASLVACRPSENSSVNKLLFFETLSSTEWNFGGRQFTPHIFFDITETITMKIKALTAYGVEIKDFPFPRSAEAVNAQAMLRGSQVGFQRAEAFELAFERFL